MLTIERPRAPERVSSKRFSDMDRAFLRKGLEVLKREDFTVTPEHKAAGATGPRLGLNNEEVARLSDVFNSEQLPKSFTQRDLWILHCAALELKSQSFTSIASEGREPTEIEKASHDLIDNLRVRIAIMRGFDNENTRRILAMTSNPLHRLANSLARLSPITG